MSDLRTAAQQALEALYEETAWFGPTPKGAAAITALRAALAEPVQEPLTEEEIESIWRQKPRWHAPPIGTTDIEFARAVEQAHGIGGEE